MIRSFLHASARRFGRRYDYDTQYMHDIIAADTRAGLRLTAFQMLSGYAGPAHANDVRMGAIVASTLDGDCGPCGQLTVDMALEAGASAEALHACLRGDAKDAGDVGLGFRFAQAAISGAPDLEALRADILRLHGPRAVVAASFAAAVGRTYPVLKRGMGHGVACQKVRIGDADIAITVPT